MSVCELIVDQEQQRWSLVSVGADCLDSAPQNMKQMNFSQWHTHGKYNVNEALKHEWWKSLQQHSQQYHILFLVLCVTFPYLVTLGTWFNHWSRPFAIIYLRLLFWGYHSHRINCGPVPSPLATMATFHCILSFLLFCETEAKLRIWLASSPDKGREAPQPT